MEHTEQNSVTLPTAGLVLPAYLKELLPIATFYPFFSPSSLFPFFPVPLLLLFSLYPSAIPLPFPHLHSVSEKTGRFVGSISFCKK